MAITSQYLNEIVQVMEQTEIPWGIFAGAAACAYGSEREIKDIDVLIPSNAGERVAVYFPKAAIGRGSNGRIAELVLPKVEIIAGLTENICLEMDAEMIARLIWRELLGVRVKLLSLEDNLVFKAILGRGPEVGKHDWEDISEILACNDPVDWQYLEWRLRCCEPERATEIVTRLQRMVD